MIRRYDTEAIDELVAKARSGDADVSYLVDALEHYRRSYGEVLAEQGAIETRARTLSIDVWGLIAPAAQEATAGTIELRQDGSCWRDGQRFDAWPHLKGAAR